MTEWQSIVSTGRMHNSYGSFVRMGRDPTKPTSQHYVEPGDTLQGIALRYSTTTEELRRINKLYYSDSILLRRFLVIPLPKNSHENMDNKTENSKTNVERASPKKLQNGTKEEEDVADDTNDAMSFLQKLDAQINAGKKVACSILSEPNYDIPSPSRSTSSRLLRRQSSLERNTETIFSQVSSSRHKDDEELFRL